MQGFVGGGVIPDDLHGSSYDGFIHAADWYTTFASLAGATVTNTGPMPVDGVDVSGALLNNKTSPRKEVVLQIISNSTGNLHAHPQRTIAPRSKARMRTSTACLPWMGYFAVRSRPPWRTGARARAWV